jgi:Fuc2NAc and GlcNAc transferase
LKNQILDVPNGRSSHSVPTPYGGGLAIVCSWLAGGIGLIGIGIVDMPIAMSIGPPAILIAAAGFVDDKFRLSAILRLAIQCAGVVWFLAFLHTPLSVGIDWLDNLPLISYVISGFALVWLINLFNFMDGIDGAAASQAAFVALAMALISFLFVRNSSLALVNIALAAACLGFLIWNWPPAKIFMGDVGSSFLGFVLGAIALIISTEYAISVWPWVILFGVFLIDSTVTLVRRASSGQRWYEAHRSHAYQRLARHWGSHRKVTLSVIGINVCWLLPMAFWAAVKPDYAAAIAGLALLPLTALALWIGAGKPDSE